jgi:hypothetical protein
MQSETLAGALPRPSVLEENGGEADFEEDSGTDQPNAGGRRDRRVLIGGAVGAMHYLEPAATLDVDVFIALPVSKGGLLSLAPIYEYLKAGGCVEKEEHIVIGEGPLQFLSSSDRIRARSNWLPYAFPRRSEFRRSCMTAAWRLLRLDEGDRKQKPLLARYR